MDYIIILFILIIVCLIIAIICIENNVYEYKPARYINPAQILYIKKSDIGGRGVFANRNIKKDETLEFSPYIEAELADLTGIIRDYVFSKSKTALKQNNTAILAFGYASMYNHSDDPSATWNIMEDGIKITATKDINKDDEIFISYGSSYWNSRTLEKKKTD
jgi:SET domain-containing protein